MEPHQLETFSRNTASSIRERITSTTYNPVD
jgi:hypothetical protein